MMHEIERFFTNLFSGIFSRFKYDAIETAERKAREAIGSRLNQPSQPSEHQPRSQPEVQEQHKDEEW